MRQEQLQRPQQQEVISVAEDTITQKVIQSEGQNEMNKNGDQSSISIIAADQTAENPGRRLIKESIAGQMQIAGQYSHRAPIQSLTPVMTFPQGGNCGGGITIGEALEATALTAGQKPVEWSDAAAIQAAEVRATGRTTISPGGVAAAAQSAATLNARAIRDEDKKKLADILADATSKLPADRPATRKDAEGVTGAEMRNDPYLTTHPAGVAASIAAAARLNQQNSFK